MKLTLLLAFALLGGQDERKEVLQKKGELTRDDNRDTVLKKSYRQAHSVRLEAGKIYRIDLVSPAFDTLLRLESPAGKVLAQDDDGGEGFNSRLLYKAERSGPHRVVVTSAEADKTGPYTLTVAEASQAEILASKVGKIADMDLTERDGLLEDLRQAFKKKGDKLDAADQQLAFTIALKLERVAPAVAARLYDEYTELFARSQYAEVKNFCRRLQGAGRRLRLVGQDVDIKGTSLEGKAFDVKEYRGKIVLVDFWATWCAPCRAELPRLRKLYEIYRDKGFEIVGVSTDRNREALEKFQEREKLPWVCLNEKRVAGDQPLSIHYGVFTVPLCILVDRDGKVLSLEARGEELERLLEKHVK